jgi:hypothetical protein
MEARSLAVCMTAIEARSLLVCMTVGASHNKYPYIQKWEAKKTFIYIALKL